MKIVPRYLLAQIKADLAKKMVFVAGPRQVGKTTLARSLPGAAAGYLNWDIDEDRSRILAGQLPTAKFWIFDEAAITSAEVRPRRGAGHASTKVGWYART
jgi:hypothetical protein